MSPIDAEISIDRMNWARTKELTAITQYMRAHYILEDMAYSFLADSVKDIAIEEMRHAEYLSQRILELGGNPVSLRDISLLDNNRNASKQFTIMRDLEEETVTAYDGFCGELAANNDHVSAQLMKKILVQEEQHYQYFYDTLTHIVALGDTFLAQMADRKYMPTEYSKFINRGKM